MFELFDHVFSFKSYAEKRRSEKTSQHQVFLKTSLFPSWEEAASSHPFFLPTGMTPLPLFFLHPMLYFNLSFIYIHIEFVVPYARRRCHGIRSGLIICFSEAAEHIHLFYVLSDEIRRKEEQLVLGRWINARLILSNVSFPVWHLQGGSGFCLNISGNSAPVSSLFSQGSS